ncbi:MAG: hypothetical protein ACD_3C00238G0001 [uncultured bacterium (gcode 4)]|uniref:Uncharacterized protein n=1 Tax=uncultured bacterium (gcode 4) TaxID=1234023 RepID=K2FW82_9BACT|nr:MAG: hypothetical protein ACD_3C00238G0001 [uncultured bacterium (gcode 4)]
MPWVDSGSNCFIAIFLIVQVAVTEDQNASQYHVEVLTHMNVIGMEKFEVDRNIQLSYKEIPVKDIRTPLQEVEAITSMSFCSKLELEFIEVSIFWLLVLFFSVVQVKTITEVIRSAEMATAISISINVNHLLELWAFLVWDIGEGVRSFLIIQDSTAYPIFLLQSAYSHYHLHTQV